MNACHFGLAPRDRAYRAGVRTGLDGALPIIPEEHAPYVQSWLAGWREGIATRIEAEQEAVQ